MAAMFDSEEFELAHRLRVRLLVLTENSVLHVLDSKSGDLLSRIQLNHKTYTGLYQHEGQVYVTYTTEDPPQLEVALLDSQDVPKRVAGFELTDPQGLKQHRVRTGIAFVDQEQHFTFLFSSQTIRQES